MTAPLLSLNGFPAKSLRVYVPEVGPWLAEVDLDDRVDLAGAAALVIGASKLSGTIDPDATGSYLVSTRASVIGGHLGWRRQAKARAHHNDAGVKASDVVNALAAEIGETVQGAGKEKLGVDYVRRAGTAARVLERLYPLWWVDYAGITQVAAARPTSEATADVEIMDFDPRGRVVQLLVSDLSGAGVGSVLRGRLDAPQVIRALDLHVTAEAMRAQAWVRAAA